MKLSKKILAAFSATALLATASFFTSCSEDDEDDPERAITGSNNSYVVDYDNTNGYEADTTTDSKNSSTKVYRAWKRTTLKHQGALTKITLKKGNGNAGNKDGVMGFAWDLTTATGTDATDDSTSETFNVVGIRNYNGTVSAYVSRYFNITNKQANNFGVTSANSSTTNPATAPTEAAEYDVSSGYQTLKTGVTDEEYSVWVDVFAKLSTTDATKDDEGTVLSKTLDDYTNASAGSWIIAIYSKDPTLESTTADDLLKSFVIPAKTNSAVGSGYDSTMTSSIQKKQAVYANVYNGGHLVGAWDYADTYHLDEVVEE